jgi:deuterolysin
MKFTPIALVAGLAASASAHVVAPHGKVAPLLDVSLKREGNSGVHMEIANNGDRDLKLLNTGTILDEGPVEKLKIYKGPKRVHFQGVQKTISTAHANDAKKGKKMWTTLKRNQKVSIKLDAGELHDLREGGDFAAHAMGTIPYSEIGEQKIRGVARFESNSLNLDKIDTMQAMKAYGKLHNRAQIQDDCQGEQLSEMQSALSICSSLAKAAAPAARAGVRLAEYFQTSDNGTAGLVGQRFDTLARDCGDTSSSDITLYCQTDFANACSDGVIAYTLPTTSQIAMCDLFWTYDAPNPDSAGCHGQDRGTTILHEFTHAGAVFQNPTDDNGYGFDAIQGLSPQENIDNADTYAQYANGISQQC